SIVPASEMACDACTAALVCTGCPSMVSWMVGASVSGDVTGFNAMSLPIALAHDDIVRAEDRHDVGNHVASGHEIERTHMNEGRGANLQAVGLPSAVAHDVEPQLALGGLGPAIDLPLRGLEPIGE